VRLGEITEPIGDIINRYAAPVKIAQWNVFNNYYTGEPVVLYRLIPKQPEPNHE